MVNRLKTQITISSLVALYLFLTPPATAGKITDNASKIVRDSCNAEQHVQLYRGNKFSADCGRGSKRTKTIEVGLDKSLQRIDIAEAIQKVCKEKPTGGTFKLHRKGENPNQVSGSFTVTCPI